MLICERIRQLRKEILHMNQNDFGKRISLSGSNVGNIEVGRVNLTDRVITDICNEFAVSENWLRNGGTDDEIFIELSEDVELSNYVSDLLDSTDDVVADLIKNFIVIYQKLDGDSKQVLKNVASDLLKKSK